MGQQCETRNILFSASFAAARDDLMFFSLIFYTQTLANTHTAIGLLLFNILSVNLLFNNLCVCVFVPLSRSAMIQWTTNEKKKCSSVQKTTIVLLMKFNDKLLSSENDLSTRRIQSTFLSVWILLVFLFSLSAVRFSSWHSSTCICASVKAIAFQSDLLSMQSRF